MSTDAPAPDTIVPGAANSPRSPSAVTWTGHPRWRVGGFETERLRAILDGVKTGR